MNSTTPAEGNGNGGSINIHDGHGFHKVPKRFYDDVRQQILNIIPALLPACDYTVEMLCGPDFWGPLSDHQKQIAGKAVAHMVRRHELPLRRVGCPHKSPARYALY